MFTKIKEKIKKRRLREVPPETYTILSQNVKMNTDYRATRRNSNVLVLGSTESGVKNSFLLPNLTQVRCSYIINDPYGALYEEFKDSLLTNGYNIHTVDFKKSIAAYNPFDCINDETKIRTIVDALLLNAPAWCQTVSCCNGAYRVLLNALVTYIHSECSSAERSLTRLAKLLFKETSDGGETLLLDTRFAELSSVNANLAAVEYYSAFKCFEPETRRSVVKLLRNELTEFYRAEGLNTADDSIAFTRENVTSIGSKPTAIFVISDPSCQYSKWLLPLLYTQLFNELIDVSENKSLRCLRHIKFLLNDFCNLGRIPELEKKVAIARPYNISFSFLAENISTPLTTYGDLWLIVEGNCDTILYLGCTESKTLEVVSLKVLRRFPRTLIKHQSCPLTMPQRLLSLSMVLGAFDVRSKFCNLPYDQCLILARGVPPIFDNKYGEGEGENDL